MLPLFTTGESALWNPALYSQGNRRIPVKETEHCRGVLCHSSGRALSPYPVSSRRAELLYI